MSTITKIQSYHRDAKQLRVAAEFQLTTLNNLKVLRISVNTIKNTLAINQTGS